MVQPMIGSNRDHFFKKRISKPDFLKTVLVTTVANSHITPPYGLCISSAFPLLIYHTHPFKKIASPTQFWQNFIFPFKKKGWDWESVENYVYSSKNLYNNIWLFLCLVVEAFWIFKYFYSCLPCLIWLFAKTQNFHFHDQIK